MQMGLNLVLEVLERTPAVLFAMLGGLSKEWLEIDEGKGTFSPREVVGHLIHAERHDWVPRIRIIVDEGGRRPFDPFDPRGFAEDIEGRAAGQLLQDFQAYRVENIKYVRSLALSEEDLEKTGEHPELGKVTLANLLTTWAVHDLDHIYQIVRVMSKMAGPHTGPWASMMRITSEET
jgi:hypothetical protein